MIGVRKAIRSRARGALVIGRGERWERGKGSFRDRGYREGIERGARGTVGIGPREAIIGDREAKGGGG